MSALIDLFRQPLFYRVGWVLVHFLWEGGVAGLLLAILLRLLNRASSHLRYLVICGTLLACGVSPVVTWMVLGRQVGAPPRISMEPARTLETRTITTLEPPIADVPVMRSLPATTDRTTVSPPWWAKGLQTLDRLLPYAVPLWLTGVLLLTFRLSLGWMQLRRIRCSGDAISDPEWQETFRRLADRMRVNATVRLLQSAIVEVPALIGWLRPVILLPASIFTGLTPGQLEAVLAHELAHVRRYDYLVNLLQTAIETVLFYHPAVWWISCKLREEREYCCDDIAVETTRDRAIYASALATLEEGRRAFQSPLVLAASDGTLVGRIRRIAGVDQRKSALAPVIATVLIVGSLLASLAGRMASGKQNPATAASLPAVDTTSAGFFPLEKSGQILTDGSGGEGIKNLKLSHLDVTNMPMHEFLAKLAELLKKENPGTSDIFLYLMVPMEDEPYSVSFHLKDESTLREILDLLNTRYPIRYRFRSAGDIGVWQISHFESAFDKSARENKIHVDVTNAPLAAALRAVQTAAAAQGFVFNIAGLDQQFGPSYLVTLPRGEISVEQALLTIFEIGHIRLYFQNGEYVIDRAQNSIQTDEMIQAVDNGDEAAARKILEQGADPNTPRLWGPNEFVVPLELAAMRGRANIIKLLLEHGAKGERALILAVHNGNAEAIKLCWEHGMRQGVSELCYAVSQSAPISDLQKLLDQGIPVDPPQDRVITPLCQAVKLGNMESVKFLVQHRTDVNKGGGAHPDLADFTLGPLAMAAAEGEDEIVIYLLKHGATDKFYALYQAIMNSRAYEVHESSRSREHYDRAAKLLVEAGALKKINKEQAGIILDAAMESATGKGNVVELEMLLDEGLNTKTPMPNASSNGKKVTVFDFYRDRYRQYEKSGKSFEIKKAADLKPLLDLLEKSDANSKSNQGGTLGSGNKPTLTKALVAAAN